jgi:hypothetical protein
MKSTVVEASNYPIPLDTLVPLKLESVTHVEVPFTYKKGPKLGQPGTFVKWEWEFLVTEGEYLGLNVRGNSEPRITSNDQASGDLALARPWVEALLGRALDLGEEIDTDDLIGLPAQGTVRHLEPRPKKEGEGFWFNTELDELFPAGMGSHSATAAAAGHANDPWAAAGLNGEPPY